MDGRGRALDNIFVERLWRTVKYENIYMNDYQTIRFRFQVSPRLRVSCAAILREP
jgi:putative transposase